jgi:hypothetical protein
VDQAGFADTRAADDTDALPDANAEIDVGEDGAACVADADIDERN